MPPQLEDLLDQIRQHPRLVVADDYEIAVQQTASCSVKYHNGEDALATRDSSIWIGLRLMHRRQPGRSASFFSQGEDLQRLVEAAFESAKRATPDPWFKFPLWKPSKSSKPPGAETPAPLEPLSILPSLYSRLKWAPPILEEVYETWQIRTRLYRKSEKLQLAHDKRIEAAHFSVLSPGEEALWLKEDRAFSRPLGDRTRWLSSLLGQACDLAEAITFTGKESAPLIVSPWVSACLLKRMAGWFSADAVQSGRSPLSGLRDAQVFSSALSLIDDGTYPDGVQTHPFDMEGSPTQRTVVVEGGVLKDHLYDVYAATRENRISTGNYMRFPGDAFPAVGATNLFIRPSGIPADDLVGAIELGYTMESLDHIAWSNESETEIYCRGSGWRIIRGERVEPIKNLSFTLDLSELCRRAVSVGNDLNFFGRFGSPSILFENIPLED